jgi:hypothetical protein
MRSTIVGKRWRLVQRTNPNIFKKNSNQDLKFEMHATDFNEPFSIIPSKLYNDFDRTAFKRHTLSFPIKVPTWYKKVPINKELAREKREVPVTPNYAHLTGNQLLLTLLRFDELGPTELSEVYENLSRHPDALGLQLEHNEIVQKVTQLISQKISTWKLDDLTRTLYAMFLLGFKDQQLWDRARKNWMDKIYGFAKHPSINFAQMFIIMFEKFGESMTPEERALLIAQLPRYLHKMNSSMIVKMFEICMGLGVIKSHTDYLFEFHFFMLFWKHPGKFSLTEAAKIIEELGKMEYFNEDKAFYEREFLPMVMRKVTGNNDNKELATFLDVIEPLKNYGIDEGLIGDWVARIQARLLYVERKLKLVDRSQFVDIIRDDLRQYREKALQEKEKGREQKGQSMQSVNGQAN